MWLVVLRVSHARGLPAPHVHPAKRGLTCRAVHVPRVRLVAPHVRLLAAVLFVQKDTTKYQQAASRVVQDVEPVMPQPFAVNVFQDIDWNKESAQEFSTAPLTRLADSK